MLISHIKNTIPASYHPYLELMRLHQPTGIWLLLFPGWWGLFLGSDGIPNLFYLALFAIGAVIMRSAGCVINDIIDRDIDPQVERTKNRPLASGALTVNQAFKCLGILLAIAVLILIVFNKLTILLGALILLPVVVYPFMKRITYWPQLFLGLTFNWGVIMGFAATQDRISLGAFVFYIGCICWTLGYDTIYAHQDKKDDEEAGVKSTALILGDESLTWIGHFYKLAIICWLIGGTLSHLNIYFFAFMGLAGWHMLWQVQEVDLEKPEDCMAKFRSNVALGVIVVVAMLIGRL